MSDVKNITKQALAQFYGSEEIHRYSVLNITDGVSFLCKNGCAWIVDIVLSYQYDPKIQKEEFQVWNLKVDLEKAEGKVTMDDGNGNILVTQEIPYTDFPLKELKLYYSNDILMLSSEY
ncbi:DUF6876 family protein [Acetobacter tropicalis]|uniref:DUF6876 family protein n=1 Tax=Acetobacter tropicalis TaxID=104102 RepID=UPI000587771C|nr:DUF6876 family protein [Acetobacter tropicalis]